MKYLVFIFVIFISLNQASTLSIAAVAECPYYCESSSNDKGFIVDALTHVFNKAGYDISYTSLDSRDKVIKGLTSGKFDLVIGVDYEHNDLIVSKKPLAYKHNVIVVPQYSKWKYDSEESLRRLKLAVIKELDYSIKLTEHIRKYKYDDSKIQVESGHLARKHNLNKLRFDKVNALIDDRVSLRYFYFKKKKPFAFKIAYTSPPKAINTSFSAKNYRSFKYTEILHRGMKKLKKNSKMKEILSKYGLNTAYISPLSKGH